ncbi:MAG TPA: hypothetical protein VFL04_07270 [Rectinemataceae bacterium]|nr:hypothetical protein [Rectinemataceae bacterium]
MVPRRLFIALAAAAALAGSAWAQARIEVDVQAGPAFMHRARFGLILVKTRPQMAIWLETAGGRFLDTIFVTHRSAVADWYGGKGVRRPEALPVWSHARGIPAPDGLFMPDRAHPLADAVSGPTPEAGFTRTWLPPSPLKPGSYLVRVELNQSFDWNEAWPDRLPKDDRRWTEANGQPSIVWEGVLEIRDTAAPAEAVLSPVGTGSLRGEDGGLRRGLEGITTARDIAASIGARYIPGD